MTKADIISEIVDETGVARKEATACVEAFMQIVKRTMAEEKEDIFLRGFGTFLIKKRAQKIARNISKNITITIPEHVIPAFKPAKAFVEELNGGAIEIIED